MRSTTARSGGWCGDSRGRELCPFFRLPRGNCLGQGRAEIRVAEAGIARRPITTTSSTSQSSRGLVTATVLTGPARQVGNLVKTWGRPVVSKPACVAWLA